MYTSGTRHEAEEGDGGWPEPEARTRPHERTDETKRNRQRNRLEVSDACSDKQSRKVGKASGYWPISLDRKACARAYVYACRIISHHIEASGSAHGAASTRAHLLMLDKSSAGGEVEVISDATRARLEPINTCFVKIDALWSTYE